jgi:hypothetical protein
MRAAWLQQLMPLWRMRLHGEVLTPATPATHNNKARANGNSAFQEY